MYDDYCSALPKPPNEIMAKELTATSVKLVWSAASPADSGRSSSSSSSTRPSYVVQYAEKSTAAAGTAEPGGAGGAVREVTDIGATEYTVTGLRADTKYEFRVIAANGLGRGTPSSPLLVTTAEHGQLPSRLLFHSSLFFLIIDL